MDKHLLALQVHYHYINRSRETPCYDGRLLYKGKVIAHVQNEGRGGADKVRLVPPFTWDQWKELEAEVAANYPKIDRSAYGLPPLDLTIEAHCHMTVERRQTLRQAKMRMKKAVLFFKVPHLPTNSADAELFSIPLTFEGQKAPNTKKVIDALEALGNYVLNTLGDDDLYEALQRAVG